MNIGRLLNLYKAYMLLAACFLLSSCGKRGCMSNNAENFEPAASVDCSCCYYSGKAGFWYTYDYQRDQLNGINSLFFYVDGVLKGKIEGYLTIYSRSTAPEFSGRYSYHSTQNNSSIILIDLEAENQKTVSIVVKTEQNKILFNRNVIIKANTIVPIQIN